MNTFHEEARRDVCYYFLYVNGHLNKDSDQNNIEYSAIKWISSVQAKTETFKFHEIAKCLPFGRLMRIFCCCFDLCLLPPVSSSCFLQFMRIFVECTTFLVGFFLKLLWSKLCLLQKHCLIVESHPLSLQLYRLWRFSQLCSCGSKLGRRAFLCGNCSKSYQLCVSVQTCPQGQSLGLYQAWWQYSRNIFVPLERLVINEAFKYSLTPASKGDSFFWLVINHTEGTLTLDFYKSPNI